MDEDNLAIDNLAWTSFVEELDVMGFRVFMKVLRWEQIMKNYGIYFLPLISVSLSLSPTHTPTNHESSQVRTDHEELWHILLARNLSPSLSLSHTQRNHESSQVRTDHGIYFLPLISLSLSRARVRAIGGP